MGEKFRAALTSRRALIVLVGAIVVLSWAIPTYGASTFKLAVKALGRANTAVHDSALAVNTSKTANSTANTANGTADAARSTAYSALSTANTANGTASSALSVASGKAQIFLNTTHSFGPGAMSGGTCTTTTFSQSGVASTDDVILTPPSTLPAGIVVQAFPSSGQLKLELCNVTGGTIDPGSVSYRFTIIR